MVIERKITIVSRLMVIVFSLLALRLWQLQVMHGDQMRDLSVKNRIRMSRVPSPRGIIYDRNGEPLVENGPYYSVVLLPEMIEEADLEAIATFLGIHSWELPEKIQNRTPLETVKLKKGISFAEVAFIEARLSEYPSLAIEVGMARHYPHGPVGSHVVGYLGRLSPSQAKKPLYKSVPRKAFIGQWGVEKLYDEHLRGTPGKKIIEVDALGRALRVIGVEKPIKGEDLYLSLDLALQAEAEQAFGDYAGALVAIKPTTGEVLALVSKPSFNPNLFSKGITYENWQDLLKEGRFPMINRALQSQYPPGSIFKIITAIAALEEGAVTTNSKVTCTGSIKHGKWRFGDWKTHGVISMHRALVESCDVYFYNAGKHTGIDAIARYARMFGLGSSTGLGLVKEKEGLIPDTQWKKRVKGLPWYLGETYNAAIGQGFVMLTPVQAARMIATVANDGALLGLTLLRSEEPSLPLWVEVSQDTLSIIKSALKDVVHGKTGTGRAAFSTTVSISGKTGTAQVISLKNVKDPENVPMRFRDHAWFVAYAPSDAPEIAISVFVEHGGHGGATAGPIARRAIEAYLSAN